VLGLSLATAGGGNNEGGHDSGENQHPTTLSASGLAQWFVSLLIHRLGHPQAL
jgi:hypothetical protein